MNLKNFDHAYEKLRKENDLLLFENAALKKELKAQRDAYELVHGLLRAKKKKEARRNNNVSFVCANCGKTHEISAGALRTRKRISVSGKLFCSIECNASRLAK